MADDPSAYVVADDYTPPTGDDDDAGSSSGAGGGGDGGATLESANRIEHPNQNQSQQQQQPNQRNTVAKSKRLSTLFTKDGQVLKEVADGAKGGGGGGGGSGGGGGDDDEEYGAANYSKLPKHFGCDNDVTPRWVMSVWLANNASVSPQRPLLDLIMAPDLVAILTLFTQVSITESDALARSVVRLFERHNDTLRLIKGSIRAEVQANVEANTLFRANSMSTKIMSVYSRMIGSALLTSVLRKPIEKVCARGTALEVDPHKEPDADKAKANMQALRETAQMFLDAILRALDKMPYQFRVICNALEEEVGKKFTNLKTSPVNGFIFLRFFCPAIFTPAAYDLLKKPPGPEAQRTLVLISKVLQNLANGQPFGGKELWMVDMNTFIMDNLETLRGFARDMAVIPNVKEPPPPSKISKEMAAESLYALAKGFEMLMPKLKQKLSEHLITATVSYKVEYRMDAVLHPDKMNNSIKLKPSASKRDLLAAHVDEYKVPTHFTVDPLPNLIDLLFATDTFLVNAMIELIYTAKPKKTAFEGDAARFAAVLGQLFYYNGKGHVFVQLLSRKACHSYLAADDLAKDPYVVAALLAILVAAVEPFMRNVLAATVKAAAAGTTAAVAAFVAACSANASGIPSTARSLLAPFIAEIDKKWSDKGLYILQCTVLGQCFAAVLDNPDGYKSIAGTLADADKARCKDVAKALHDLVPGSLAGGPHAAHSQQLKSIASAFAGPVDADTTVDFTSETLQKLAEDLHGFVAANAIQITKLINDHRSQEAVTYKILEILEAVVFLFLSHTPPPPAKDPKKK